MTEFIIANMAPIIFISMIFFLLVGFPVAFALAANGVVFGLLGIELGLIGPQIFQAMPDRIFSVMANLAAPIDAFFTAVMVMDENMAVRNNRLALLQGILALTNGIADFSKLVTA